MTTPAGLTTLEGIKLYLSIPTATTTDDALLTALGIAASNKMERLCNRTFAATDYEIWLTAARERHMVLPNYPIIYVYKLATGTNIALNVQAAPANFLQATFSVNSLGVMLYSVAVTTGTVTKTPILFSAAKTTGLLATAINAVTGWTAVDLAHCRSNELRPLAGVSCLGRIAYATYPWENITDYAVQEANGIISLRLGSSVWPYDDDMRFLPMPLEYFISYRAGYETLPPDLVQLANEFTADIYKTAGLNRNLSSESLGDYSYSLADETALTEGFTARLMQWKQYAISSPMVQP
jgi:hypothetical protein